MTSPLQQKLRITGPVVVTANRLDDGVVIYRTSGAAMSTSIAPALGRADRGRIKAAAPDEWHLSAAARLYAADRYSLRRPVVGPDAHARACGAPLRSQLRPFHHPAEHPVQLDQARRAAGCHG